MRYIHITTQCYNFHYVTIYHLVLYCGIIPNDDLYIYIYIIYIYIYIYSMYIYLYITNI